MWTEKINKLKIKNSINSTSFHKLKANEKKFASLSLLNSKDNKQIPFFFSSDNDWVKILDDELKTNLIKFLKKI